MKVPNDLADMGGDMGPGDRGLEVAVECVGEGRVKAENR